MKSKILLWVLLLCGLISASKKNKVRKKREDYITSPEVVPIKNILFAKDDTAQCGKFYDPKDKTVKQDKKIYPHRIKRFCKLTNRTVSVMLTKKQYLCTQKNDDDLADCGYNTFYYSGRYNWVVWNQTLFDSAHKNLPGENAFTMFNSPSFSQVYGEVIIHKSKKKGDFEGLHKVNWADWNSYIGSQVQFMEDGSDMCFIPNSSALWFKLDPNVEVSFDDVPLTERDGYDDDDVYLGEDVKMF